MKIGIVIGVIVILFGGGIYLANNNGAGSGDQSSTNQSTQQLADGTVIYDVRTAEEFAAGHAEEAINLPVEAITDGTYPDVDKDTPIAVYCRSGNRSGQATTILTQAGFTNITDIGAFENLENYGLKTV